MRWLHTLLASDKRETGRWPYGALRNVIEFALILAFLVLMVLLLLTVKTTP